MALTEKKAYENGRRMGEYIINRDGIEKAIKRGSLSHVRYSKKVFIDAYDKGYREAVNA